VAKGRSGDELSLVQNEGLKGGRASTRGPIFAESCLKKKGYGTMQLLSTKQQGVYCKLAEGGKKERGPSEQGN